MAPLLKFAVQVSEPELILPETPTPSELKYLSNIDDQAGLRNHIPFVHFYPPSKNNDDPVPVIRMGVSKALVLYYPIAGRLREGNNGKLVVDCCCEGVIFREADANISLERLRELNDGGLKPPFPQWESLLVDDVWGSQKITNSPLLRIQVTRLACGGFFLAYTFNHCVCDAFGALQFITVVSDFCRNPHQTTPSITPSWGREALTPRTPPHVSYPHPEYDLDSNSSFAPTESDYKQLVQTSVFLSNTDVSNLKSQINGGKVPSFDAISSCLWRARTRTLLKPNTVAKLLFPIDTRFHYKPTLPNGYYGSAVVFPCAMAKASELVEKPLVYAAKLVGEVKKGVVGDEYRSSALDFIEVNGRRGFCMEGAFVVSDMTRLKFVDVDFGWGSGVYGGPLRAGTGLVPGMVTSVIGHRNEKDVHGVLALVSLPSQDLNRFHAEVRKEVSGWAPVFHTSAL